MNIDWKITQLKRTPDTEVVFNVTYIMGFELSGSRARHVGDVTITGSVDDAGFIPYGDLTQDTVIGWVTGSLGQDEINRISSEYETVLTERAHRRNNPTELSGLPW